MSSPEVPGESAGKIFVSYSQYDYAAAQRICVHLEAKGRTCWIAPRNILAGADFAASIALAIQDCAAVVLVFSSQSNISRQVARELKLADDACKPIIPVRTESVLPAGNIAYFLGAAQWVEAIGGPHDNHLASLDTAVSKHLYTKNLDPLRRSYLKAPLASEKDETNINSETGEPERQHQLWSTVSAQSDAGRIVLEEGPGGVVPPALCSPVPENRQCNKKGQRGWHQFLLKRNIAARWSLIIVLASIGGIFLLVKSRQTEPLETIAVLPFANDSGHPSLDYLSEGLSESLTNSLSQIQDLTVRSRSSVLRYKPGTIDPRLAAQRLRVAAVVTGRIFSRGDNTGLTASLSLIDSKNSRQLWGDTYNFDPDAIAIVVRKAVSRISDQLRSRLDPSQRQRILASLPDENEAYRLYLQGRYYFNKRTNDSAPRALELFTSAAARAPGYALAYTGIADTYVLESGFVPPSEVFPKAMAAASKALEFDPELAEAHLSRAYVAFFYDWNFVEAEKYYRAAITIKPNYAPVHAALARLLNVEKRFLEAQNEFQRAINLDPLLLPALAGLGNSFYLQRDYDRALKQLLDLEKFEPSFGLVHINLGEVYTQKQMLTKAIEELETALRLMGEDAGVLSQLGYIYAISGSPLKAKEVLTRLHALASKRYVAPPFFAYVCVALGDHEGAFEWLERGYAERSYPMVFLNVYPLIDPLRSDPRFADLLRRVGLS